MRLIDADKLVEAIGNTPSEVTKIHTYNVLSSLAERQNEILDIVENSPTIEATPVMHGWWIDMGDFQSCSICKATRLKEIGTPYGKAIWVKTKFCPDCGAKMDGGVSDG